MADNRSEPSPFTFETERIALPTGAWEKTRRRRLAVDGRTVLALTQGEFRSYIYPLNTPAGFAVTSERPADHPHHASLWIASDHVHAKVPAAGDAVEDYTYNFYVDEVFQGRAPGRILERSCEGRDNGDGRFRIVQRLEWMGPVEWAAPAGRCIAAETRTLTVHRDERRHRIDLTSELTARDWAIRLGPTRHAYFNVRVADGMIVANGGSIRDDRGRIGGEAVSGEGAAWVDFTGDVGGGRRAGVTVVPHPLAGRPPFWFAADWGVVTVGPFRSEALDLRAGESFTAGCTLLVHDGELDVADCQDVLGQPGGAA